MSSLLGQHVWYELMSTDLAGAEAFYTKVTGWELVDSGQPGPRYDLIRAGGISVGGMMALPDEAIAGGAKPAWQAYIAVADVDAAAQAVAADGGKVWVPGTDIPGTGRFAMVSDPGGAGYYVFKGLPGDEPPAPPPGTPGRFVWHELYASDPAAAWDFYSRHYGWVKGEGMDMGDMGTYQLFSTLPGADSAGGMMTLPPQMPRPMWLYYVAVEAIDAAAARVTAAGGQVLFGPSEVPGGSWIINALDPQGALFALVAPRR